MTMCCTFNADCQYDHRIINFIENVHCWNTKYFGKICMQKKFFNFLKEGIINVFIASPRVKSAKFILKNEQFNFSWRVSRGFTILERHKNHFDRRSKMFIFQKASVWEKNMSMSILGKKYEICYKCLQRETWCHVLKILFEGQKLSFKLFRCDAKHVFHGGVGRN